MATTNKKSYNVSLRKKKSYKVSLFGFQYAATLIANIRQKLPITFVASLTTKLATTINVKRIRLIISKTSLIQKITQTISSRTIKTIMVMKLRQKLVTIISQKHPLLFSPKLRQRLGTTINNGILSLVMSPIVAIFFTLGDFDPDTLLTMDSQTLGELDYTEA